MHNRDKEDLREEIEDRKAAEFLLFLQIEKLQKQVQEEKKKTQNLEEKIEMMLMWAPHSPNPMQIRKLMVPPQDWDGNIWGDPGNCDEENDDPSFPSDYSEYGTIPIIKVD
ncbi:hypothetical protein WISP_55110 [Willisornis vidua]|uniref:Uncharacterized protein n=1 Tax=Willisornis vidua TaxID=1566151 RepID=A0ABQ9DGY5_9PASS|nr:hypothetical protein WISP_55110 [Willisornis vidua]